MILQSLAILIAARGSAGLVPQPAPGIIPNMPNTAQSNLISKIKDPEIRAGVVAAVNKNILSAAVEGCFQPVWSAEILNEAIRNLLIDRRINQEGAAWLLRQLNYP